MSAAGGGAVGGDVYASGTWYGAVATGGGGGAL